MLLFVAILFQIPLVHNPVSANKVISYSEKSENHQMYFPWQSSGGAVSKDYKDLDIKSKYGNYRVRCESFDKHDPMMWLYTEDGVLLEAAQLTNHLSSSKDCSQSNFDTFITPDSMKNGKLVFIFGYWGSDANRIIRMMRKYTVNRNLVTAEVERSDDEIIHTFSYITKYCEQNPDYKRNGIIAADQSMAVLATGGMARFEVPYKTSQDNEILEFPQKDLKSKTFKLSCGKHKTDKGSTVMVGSVIHEDYVGAVLENFELESCSLENINVNRRIVNKENHFKTVFEKADGTCEEREYKFREDKPYTFYNRLTVIREGAKIVKCPSSFVGDIGVNSFVPWLRIQLLRSILLLFFKPEPYGVES